jgi:hypothetical protein
MDYNTREYLLALTAACCVAFTTGSVAVTVFFGLMSPIV